MSFDIDYRPLHYADVLGQTSIIKILRSIVAQGRGFEQSYLFCGPWGGGKTTLGRILARALLCATPTPEGDPCNQCPSCKSLLDNGTSVDFVEVDAATNSGKADVNKIKDEIQYSTFSGRRPIYLFDEAHQLTPGALDALLLPMEESIAGTKDKELVCIFCTTEPEKMHDTVLSRCAPAFVLQPVEPDIIAGRLEHICKEENVEADPAMLKLIAEISECHIRDALKAIEGVSMLGPINQENVTSYLHLDMNVTFLEVIENIGQDLGVALEAAKKALERSSPVSAYKKLAEVAMLAFQMTLGLKPPTFWDTDRLQALGERHGAGLLGFATRFASRPGRPTSSMLFCDIGHLHYVGATAVGAQPVVVAPSTTGAPAPNPTPPSVQTSKSNGKLSTGPSVSGKAEVQKDVRAIRDRSREAKQNPDAQSPAIPGKLPLSEFCHLLALTIAERDGAQSGPARRTYLDSDRAQSPGGDPS